MKVMLAELPFTLSFQLITKHGCIKQKTKKFASTCCYLGVELMARRQVVTIAHGVTDIPVVPHVISMVLWIKNTLDLLSNDREDIFKVIDCISKIYCFCQFGI
jgi:hypothetical protein